MITTLPILLVEDDMVDVMAMKRAFRELKVSNPLHVARNGEEALHHLRDAQHITPGLILLDLNMPRMNGLDFLRAVKDDEQLRRIPVVVLTTSKEKKDRAESFDQSAAGYMIKPVNYAEFVEVVRTIQAYWSLSEQPM